ncbi:MAG TPA: hypothetical protein VFQ61_15895 [Polyangiaceae bacterium]|nr:hypothetical protein [Polyangiaceae bacterium]
MTSRDPLSRLVNAGAALAALALLSKTAHAGNAKLLVFLHLAVKQRALQGDIQAALPGVEVTAVGRIGDFERALKEGADAVMAVPPVLAAFNLSARLRGVRGGATEEKYCLVGVGAEPDPAKVATVGATDLLGRDKTTQFVKDIMGTAPHVERVSKVEDLLPLLQMQRADAILMPSRLFSDIKSASKLALVQKELSKTVGLPSVAVVTPTGDPAVGSIAKLPGAVMKTLGVDSWR